MLEMTLDKSINLEIWFHICGTWELILPPTLCLVYYAVNSSKQELIMGQRYYLGLGAYCSGHFKVLP